jgi:hypothetical protein
MMSRPGLREQIERALNPDNPKLPESLDREADLKALESLEARCALAAHIKNG